MKDSSINKNYLKRRFRQSLKTYDKTAVVQEQMADRLLDILCETCSNSFDRILEFGSGSGLLTRHVVERLQFQQLFVNDIVDESEHYLKAFSNRMTFLKGDIEAIDFPSELDLVIANASVQWLTHPQAFFSKVSDSLVPNGIFAFTSFGPKNYQEVAAITGQSLSYYSLDEIQEMAAPHLEVCQSEEAIRPLPFSTPKDVLKHIKESGTNSLSPVNWKKRDLQAFSTAYEKSFSTGGNVQLTYHPYYFVLKQRP